MASNNNGGGEFKDANEGTETMNLRGRTVNRNNTRETGAGWSSAGETASGAGRHGTNGTGVISKRAAYMDIVKKPLISKIDTPDLVQWLLQRSEYERIWLLLDGRIILWIIRIPLFLQN